MLRPAAIPTNVVSSVDDIRVHPHPTVLGITVLELLTVGADGVKVPLAAAWLTESEWREVARQVDPVTYREAGELAAAAQLLAEEVEPARYVTGPAGCIYDRRADRTCEEYFDRNGCDRLDVEYCSHVEYRTASVADVYARQRLEAMLLRWRDLAAQLDSPLPPDVAETIDRDLSGLRQDLEGLGGRAVFTVADYRAAAAELDAATARWNDRDGADALHEAHEENRRLRAEVHQLAQAAGLRVYQPCARCGTKNLPPDQPVCDPPCAPIVTTTREAS